MIKSTHLLLLVILSGCFNPSPREEFVSTKYINDSKNLELEQIINNRNSKEFLVVYFDESKSLSGNKILKLYSSDSTSTGESFYGSHPLEILSWSDSLIIISAGVYSAHGDSTYRKWYLDNSVDKNKTIGNYRIKYQKNYDYHID